MTNKAKRQNLNQRAQAIIDDPTRYDPDTRHAVRNVLEREGPDLAEYVGRAERGDTILDLVKPLKGAPEQAVTERGNDSEQRTPVGELAAMLEAVLSHAEMPQALFDVVVDYFQERIERTGLAATIPEISKRPVMEMVLAAERRRELFAEEQDAARLKSRVRAAGAGEQHATQQKEGAI
jgi:hypothetical protein